MLSSEPLAVGVFRGPGEPVRFLQEWRQGRKGELSGFSCPYFGHCFLLPSFTLVCGSCPGMAPEKSPRVGVVATSRNWEYSSGSTGQCCCQSSVLKVPNPKHHGADKALRQGSIFPALMPACACRSCHLLQGIPG